MLQAPPSNVSKVVKPPKEANARPRGATGRFAASDQVVGVVALSPALTRQERRNQKRLVVKLAGGWREVTGGKGVMLVDGKPVDVKGGDSI